MRLEKMAAFAEIISSVAIVGTLGYLALQTQQTNAQLASQSRMNIYEMRSAISRQVIEDEGGIGSLIAGARQGEELTGYESARINARSTWILDSVQFMYLEDQHATEQAVPWFMRVWETSPNMSNTWTQTKARYEPRFVNFVDRMIIPGLTE